MSGSQLRDKFLHKLQRKQHLPSIRTGMPRLKSNPKDINALFNLGMIKYRGKSDNAGAIAAWEQLLKTNPNLDRKPMVEQLIAEARSAPAPKN